MKLKRLYQNKVIIKNLNLILIFYDNTNNKIS